MIRVVMLALALVASCHQSQPNGSTDGRFHTCGYTTEQGVTENLNIYRERCANQ